MIGCVADADELTIGRKEAAAAPPVDWCARRAEIRFAEKAIDRRDLALPDRRVRSLVAADGKHAV